MEKQQATDLSKKHSLLKNIFNRDFVVSAIIPIVIFSVFNELKMPLSGIILSALWSIGIILLNFIKDRKLNSLAILAGIFAIIGLIGTIISRTPTFYLITPIVQDILWAIIFFGSLFFKRSLIQVIVEQSYLKDAPEELKKKAKYKSAWTILTIAWGLLNISQAVLRIILLYSTSMETYYAVSTVCGNISGPLLLAFSISFPKWYWKSSKTS